jgi:hypothetical protein
MPKNREEKKWNNLSYPPPPPPTHLAKKLVKLLGLILASALLLANCESSRSKSNKAIDTRKTITAQQENAVKLIDGIDTDGNKAYANDGGVQSIDQTAQYGQAVRYEQEKNYNILRGILKIHNTFRRTTENANIKLQIDFTDENFSVLRTKYDLDTIAGTGGDLSKSLNILFWLCEHTDHFGSYDDHIPMNSLDLLEYSYDKGAAQGLNCLNLSYILTECLLSIGVPARTVGIMPFSPYDSDNHVVTHAYIAGLDKWIMLDPTWCSYFKDAEGNILDVFELRAFLTDDRDVFLNEEFSYNGSKLITNSERVQYYKRYMTKNLFYFSTYEISSFGSENYGRNVHVCPVGFNLFEAQMYGVEYRIELIRTDKNLTEGYSEAFVESYVEFSTKVLENMKIFAEENEGSTERAYFYVSPEDFLARPDLKNK